jgi:hypothetical protein
MDDDSVYVSIGDVACFVSSMAAGPVMHKRKNGLDHSIMRNDILRNNLIRHRKEDGIQTNA